MIKLERVENAHFLPAALPPLSSTDNVSYPDSLVFNSFNQVNKYGESALAKVVCRMLGKIGVKVIYNAFTDRDRTYITTYVIF